MHECGSSSGHSPQIRETCSPHGRGQVPSSFRRRPQVYARLTPVGSGTAAPQVLGSMTKTVRVICISSQPCGLLSAAPTEGPKEQDMRKLTRPMIEALRVALVQDTVWVGARWEIGVGYVKTGTICALIDRDLIMRNPWGEWELTRAGINALAEETIILSAQAHDAFDARIEQAHAEALHHNETLICAAIEAGDERAINQAKADAAHAEALRVDELMTENGQCRDTERCHLDHGHPGACRIVTTERDARIDAAHAEALSDAEMKSIIERSQAGLYHCGRRWKTASGTFMCDVRVPFPKVVADVTHEGPCYDAIHRVWSRWSPDVRSEPIKELTKFVIDDGTKLRGIRDALSDLVDRWHGSEYASRRTDAADLERVLREFE